jgi:hypothetical protein
MDWNNVVYNLRTRTKGKAQPLHGFVGQLCKQPDRLSHWRSGTFAPRQNITKFSKLLAVDLDPRQRLFLMRLRIEEEDQFGLGLEQLQRLPVDLNQDGFRGSGEALWH